MNRLSNQTILVLACCLIGLLSVPSSSSEKLRGMAVASLANVWMPVVDLKLLLQAPFDRSFNDDVQDLVKTKDQEIERLLLENQLLGNEIQRLKEIVEQDHAMLHQMLDEQQLKFVPPATKALLDRHLQQQLNLFQLQLINIPARVIYRPLNAWNSSLWVDVGESDNRRLQRQVIEKNSPVVIGTCVVGVVDYVGEKQSRIRLITDSGLNPSVRVKRGPKLLAKGELNGQCQTALRSHRPLLKGTGFNYDFADSEGPGRDLRTGEAIDGSKPAPVPLVQVGDLLVTTGMDGVFPAGLKVAVVKKIFPLQEGDDTYELEAESAAGDLNRLTLVFILPSQGYNPDDNALIY